MRNGFVLLIATLVVLGAGTALSARPVDPTQVTDPAEADAQQADAVTLPDAPASSGPVAIQAPRLPATPADGKGRLNLALEGNRRWCTFPDDRVVHPPESRTPRSAQPANKNAVYTFGYQFTIAAVERSNPAAVQMLFEGPVVRTATYREAVKVGRGVAKPNTGPQIMDPDDSRAAKLQTEQPSTPVPYWQEQYRCATMPEEIDLDLDPGVYDIYMAFDILLKSGNWVHRSTAFQTDVTVEGGRTTRLQGVVNMAAGGRRELDLSGGTSDSAGAGVH